MHKVGYVFHLINNDLRYQAAGLGTTVMAEVSNALLRPFSKIPE